MLFEGSIFLLNLMNYFQISTFSWVFLLPYAPEIQHSTAPERSVRNGNFHSKHCLAAI